MSATCLQLMCSFRSDKSVFGSYRALNDSFGRKPLVEGSRLTHEQTRLIFETATVGIGAETVRVDDIIETRLT